MLHLIIALLAGKGGGSVFPADAVGGSGSDTEDGKVNIDSHVFTGS